MSIEPTISSMFAVCFAGAVNWPLIMFFRCAPGANSLAYAKPLGHTATRTQTQPHTATHRPTFTATRPTIAHRGGSEFRSIFLCRKLLSAAGVSAVSNEFDSRDLLESESRKRQTWKGFLCPRNCQPRTFRLFYADPGLPTGIKQNDIKATRKRLQKWTSKPQQIDDQTATRQQPIDNKTATRQRRDSNKTTPGREPEIKTTKKVFFSESKNRNRFHTQRSINGFVRLSKRRASSAYQVPISDSSRTSG